MKRKLPFLLAAAVLLTVALVSGYKICTILAEYRAGEAAAESMQQFIQLEPTMPPATQPAAETTPGEPTEAPTEPTEPPFPYPEVDFEALQAINSDVIGWIYIPDTNINYPIVQGTDNRRYLSVMADGTRNAAGAIFMDYRCLADFSERHSILYGHNMKNGTMFHDIRRYSDPEFYAEHPEGMVMTPEGNFRFEVIAGYIARTDSGAWKLSFQDDQDFEDWLELTMSRSIIGGTASPTAEDRILTLSTCTYEIEDGRYVLICRILP